MGQYTCKPPKRRRRRDRFKCWCAHASGDRSDKIRTYNFPDNRLTDHRIGFTIYKLDQIIRGDLQPVTDALVEYDRNRLRDQMGVLE